MESYLELLGTTLTVKLPEEVDHHNSEEISRTTEHVISRRLVRKIIFDFDRTVFMDSSGIGMMIGRYKTMRFMGGTALAVHVNQRMSRILALSGMEKLMDIYEKED